MNWENLREEEFRDAIEKSGGLCVLPMGCVEKHGQHLPVGTDSIAARSVVEQAAAMEEVVVFPGAMWLGDVCSMHACKDPLADKKAGYISLNPRTLLTLMEELCDEMARNGFRKILIVNNHGGNSSLLSYFMRMQSYHRRKEYATMVTNLYESNCQRADLFYALIRNNRKEYPMITDADLEVLKGYAEREGGYGGGHGDFTETARILGAAPSLVAPDRYDAESGLSLRRSDYLAAEGVRIVGSWSADFPNALDGYPSFGCSESIGQAINLYSARRLARIFKLIKEDEECIRIAQLLPRLT